MEKIDTKRELEGILKRIKETRKERGLSLESMGNGIGLSEAGYRKIEENETTLTLERFLKIAAELEVSAKELIDAKSQREYNQYNNEKGTFIGHQEFENYYQENKEITQNLINSYKERILHQQEEILFLRSQLADKRTV